MQNTKLFLPLLIVFILLLGIGGYVFRNDSDTPDTQEVPSVQVQEAELPNMEDPTGEVIMEKDQETETAMEPASDGRYIKYSKEAVASAIAQGKTVVLFFHASWCPTCIAADKDITQNLSTLPENIVVFKVDYDGNPELKKQYNVTYQHTFVEIDSDMNEVQSWNGGGVAELVSKL